MHVWRGSPGRIWSHNYVCDVRLREDLKGNICPRLEVGAFARQYQYLRTPKMGRCDANNYGGTMSPRVSTLHVPDATHMTKSPRHSLSIFSVPKPEVVKV